MTCNVDIEYGIECPSERTHTFASVNVVSELSSFIDIEEVHLSGGASAKPVGDGAFGVVYKGKVRSGVSRMIGYCSNSHRVSVSRSRCCREDVESSRHA